MITEWLVMQVKLSELQHTLKKHSESGMKVHTILGPDTGNMYTIVSRIEVAG